MKAIVAVDNNWAIGYGNSLLVSIPEDHKQFRKITMGNAIILGRKTLEGFPNGIPLAGRQNIIFSRNNDFKAKGANIVHSKEELFKLLNLVEEDVFVIGGGTIYELLLPYCDTVYVTKINYNYQADTYFPNLDKLENWEMIEESDEHTYFSVEFTYQTYKNNTPLEFS